VNPWGLVVSGIGVLLIVVGVKGTQHRIVAAITGKTVNVPSQHSGSGSGSNPLPGWSGPVPQVPPIGPGPVIA
jgi:hypothetical protein